MIYTEALINVLYFVSIIAVCLLIVVLWRLFDILGDVKSTTARINHRTKQLDELVDNIINSFKGGLDTLKGIFYSLDLVRAIRKKVNNMTSQEDEEEKKE